MFSYSFKIRKLNTPSKLKAFVSIVIDDVMEVDGFKIVDGSNGLFVSAPSHKGTVMEDGVKVEKYFDDVRFVGEEGIAISNELSKLLFLNIIQVQILLQLLVLKLQLELLLPKLKLLYLSLRHQSLQQEKNLFGDFNK
jgi:DNA-binding cell septation regulator SpoVG